MIGKHLSHIYSVSYNVPAHAITSLTLSEKLLSLYILTLIRTRLYVYVRTSCLECALECIQLFIP